MKRFSTLLAIACLLFVILPTVPPWMATSPKFPYQLFGELHRDAGRGFAISASTASPTTTRFNSATATHAAMPSLHSSLLSSCPLFLPWIRPKWLKAVVLLFPVMMLTSLVYRRTLGDRRLVGCRHRRQFLVLNRMERRTRMAQHSPARH